MMEEGVEVGDERTYEPLNTATLRNNFDTSPSHSPPPKDTRNIVYLSLLTAGIGFVLPYNAFIIASDYWSERFPSRSVELDLSCTYIIVAFASVLLNNIFLSIAPFRIRILFGYIISFVTLIFVATCEVAWHIFSAQTAYSVNLAAVSLVALGCTVQQSSFYGFAALLPKKKYTQALMTGESIAGFLVSSNRVATKLLIQSDKISTVIFFLTSTMYIAFSYFLHVVTIESPFIKYHMKSCTKIILRPDEDQDVNSFFGVDTPPTQATAALSFSNPVYELQNPSNGNSDSNAESSLIKLETTSTSITTTINHDVISSPIGGSTPAYKVEHVLSSNRAKITSFRRIKEGMNERIKVARQIYPYMVSIALAYLVTLSLYPGLESEIISCSLKSWMPVLLMFTFNTTDVLGKILAAVPYAWSRRQLILLSSLRTLIIPLLLLCVSPRKNPTISGEWPAFMFTAALGVTNGLAGSLPMLLAPLKVDTQHKELSGNIMTISYMSGLTVGSLVGYVFENMLGPPIPFPCLHQQYPYIPKPPDDIETTSTTQSTLTMITTLATTILTKNATQNLITTQAVPTSSSSFNYTSMMTTDYDHFTVEMTNLVNLSSSFSPTPGLTTLNSTILNDI